MPCRQRSFALCSGALFFLQMFRGCLNGVSSVDGLKVARPLFGFSEIKSVLQIPWVADPCHSLLPGWLEEGLGVRN